jgi:carboxypeptidase Taq
MIVSDTYAELTRRFARMQALAEAVGLLDWDTQVVMPGGGAEARSDLMATLRVLRHEMLTAPDLDDLLDRADDGGDPWRRADLREMRRDRLHATALPADLVAANSRAASRCETVWRTARPASDFAAIRPSLDEVVRLQREIAAAKSERLGLAPYDALLDLYQPDGRSAEIDRLFDALTGTLPGLLGAVLERQAARPAPPSPDGPFPVEAQRALGVAMMAAVGLEPDRTRLDVSAHPFCKGLAGEVRITTRYDTADFTGALMGVLHEAGHALYHRGLPDGARDQPAGRHRGMAIHESQSLIVEMQACRSPAFLGWLAPRAADAFGASGPAWTPANLVRLYGRVSRGFIRVEADEVTYPLHVILRYRLERAMIAGDLAVADLPAAWAEGMRDLLGVVPPDDRRGCLQDIHWPTGAFGYFPCYTLGALGAAQLFGAALRDEPGIPDALGRGDFAPLVGWLRQHVHARASSVDQATLMVEATGRPLGVEAFLAHLRRRYLDA